MALRITKSTDPIRVEQLVVCVYAVPGVGKSTLAFTSEDPLLLDFDRGAYRTANRRDAVEVDSWQDVAGITAEDLAPYKTIIVDTAGRALDSLAVDIIRRDPKKGRGGALTLQGFGTLKAEFIAWTKLLKSFGKDVVLIAHSDEQRSGDELIERIDMQGASKNEVYKSADAMARLSIQGQNRVLNFSPTDAAFGKNPAGLEPLIVPDVSADPDFLAEIIQCIKDKLNSLTEDQAAELKRFEGLQADLEALESVDEFNQQIKKMAESSSKDKSLLLSVAQAKGFDFDKKTKAFKAREAA